MPGRQREPVRHVDPRGGAALRRFFSARRRKRGESIFVPSERTAKWPRPRSMPMVRSVSGIRVASAVGSVPMTKEAAVLAEPGDPRQPRRVDGDPDVAGRFAARAARDVHGDGEALVGGPGSFVGVVHDEHLRRLEPQHHPARGVGRAGRRGGGGHTHGDARGHGRGRSRGHHRGHDGEHRRQSRRPVRPEAAGPAAVSATASRHHATPSRRRSGGRAATASPADGPRASPPCGCVCSSCRWRRRGSCGPWTPTGAASRRCRRPSPRPRRPSGRRARGR